MEFSFRRLWLLIVSQITERKSIMLLTLLLYFLLPVAFTPFDFLNKVIYILIAICPFAWTANHSFINYNRPAKRSNAILLPASREEKYLSAFLLNFIAMPVLIVFVGFLGLYVGEVIFPETVLGNSTAMQTSEEGEVMTLYEALGLLAGISVCFYGSLLFRKYHFASVFGIVIAGLLQFEYLQRVMIPIMKPGNCMTQMYNNINDYISVLFAVCIPFFLILTYFRLKEERV